MKHHTKNILSMLGYEALSRVIAFIGTAYLARVLGTDGFGLVNYALAFLSYGLLVANPGIHIISTRMIAQELHEEGSVVRSITALKFLLAVLITVIIGGLILMMNGDPTQQMLILITSSTVIPLALQLDWVFQGRQDMTSLGIGKAVSSLGTTIIILCFIETANDTLYASVGYFVGAAGSALTLFALYFFGRRRTAEATRPTEELPGWRQILLNSLPLGFSSTAAQIIITLPFVLLGWLSSNADVGIYSAAWKIIFFLLALDRGIYVLFYPVISKTFASKKDNVQTQIAQVIKYALLAGVPMMIGTMVVSQQLLVLLFGPGFEHGDHILQILALFFFATIVNSLFAYTLIAIGQENLFSRAMIRGSIISACCILILTWFFGSEGAALGLSLGEIMIVLGVAQNLRKQMSISFMKNFSKPLFASLGMAICTLVVSSWGIWVMIPVGIISYCAFIVFLKGIDKEDLKFLRERFV